MRMLKSNGFPLFVLFATVFYFGSGSNLNLRAQEWKFKDIVDVKFVKQYIKIPAPKGVMIVDSRPTKAKYDNGHIPNAVSIPDSQFDKLKHQLPGDKNTLLIFYCQGPT